MLGALPETHNNPFALIQPQPSPWQGLVGKTASGFLIFENPMYGVRAGFINLVNRYINQGLNTIEKIFPIYAPLGHGDNNPAAYISTVEKLSGIPRSQVITTSDDIYRIGRAIVQVEEGNFWVSQADFDEGFRRAMENRNIQIAVKTGAGAMGLLMVAGLIYYMVISQRAKKIKKQQ